MPYAMPSPSTSPTFTMTMPASPRAEQKRPVRHHMRSHSTDAIQTTSSFIFVQPATPSEKLSSTASPSSSTSVNAEAGPSTSPIPLARRRIKLFGFTPAVGGSDEGPSSQEDSSVGEGIQSDDALARPKTTLSISTSGVAPTRRQSSPSASASHVAHIQASFPSRTTAMVRKKSGELVRSSLKSKDSMRRDKPQSAPATPVCPKYVHFDTQLEHVKHFLAQQRPAAVSRTGSPVETETEDEPEAFPFPAMASAQAGTIKLKLPNFPARVNHDQDVYIESLEMAKDGKSIRGIVRVRNLAFEKWVAVRFTLDHWQTVSEVSAEHLESMGGNSDRFVFSIRLQDLLARIEEKTMFIAVRYTVGGREIWDNNDGQNYRVEFVKPVVSAAVVNAAAQRIIGNASKRQGGWAGGRVGAQDSSVMADLRRELDRLKQDEDGPPSPRKFDTRNFTEGSPTVLHNRYDFGASLKQAPGPRPGASFSASAYPPVSTSPPKQSAAFMAAAAAGAFREPVTTPTPMGASTTVLRLNEAPSSSQSTPTLSRDVSSPVINRDELPPNFGDSPSGTSSSFYQATSPLYNPAPLYQQQQRPPSPPSEMTLKHFYTQYGGQLNLPLNGGASSPAGSARFNSYPPNRNSSPSTSVPPPQNGLATMHYAPLLPPTFRELRRRDSPFASPIGSPYNSPGISPSMSPAQSPARSPQSASPPRASSPPLYPTISPPSGEAGVWSPGGSSSDANSQSSSTATNEGSPDSAATSVPESPSQGPYGYGTQPQRPKGPLEFSSFLDRYCFHASSHPGSLGLVSVTPELSPALTPNGGTAAEPLYDSPSTTPRRSTPIANGMPPSIPQQFQSSHGSARVYYTGSNSTSNASSQNNSASSSGSSTPASRSHYAHDGNESNPLEGFAAFAPSRGPSSTVVS